MAVHTWRTYRAFVTQAEAAIDDDKERAWMDTYETDRDTLEDVLYRRLESLWAPFTDALKVFQKHNASQPRCAQKVWEDCQRWTLWGLDIRDLEILGTGSWTLGGRNIGGPRLE